MENTITIGNNALSVIEYNNQRVLTTKQLAEGYGTEPQIITNNFNRNKARYEIGKHYFPIKGTKKTEFLNQHQFDLGSKNAKILYLWTERGALLHAKSLNTDKAWDVYDMLVELYFRVKETVQPSSADTRLETIEQSLARCQATVIGMNDTANGNYERINASVSTINREIISIEDELADIDSNFDEVAEHMVVLEDKYASVTAIHLNPVMYKKQNVIDRALELAAHDSLIWMDGNMGRLANICKDKMRQMKIKDIRKVAEMFANKFERWGDEPLYCGDKFRDENDPYCNTLTTLYDLILGELCCVFMRDYRGNMDMYKSIGCAKVAVG